MWKLRLQTRDRGKLLQAFEALQIKKNNVFREKSSFFLFPFQFFSYLCARKTSFAPIKNLRRDGRVVDYSGLENRRTERYRGFESLSLR